MDKHIDRLLEVLYSIKVGKITVLTGSNGSGKSFIRKMLWQSVNKQLGIDARKSSISGVSMQLRTASQPAWGGLSSIMHDDENSPTSLSTFELIETLFKGDRKDRFFVIDEPEIGMSKESQLGITNYINSHSKKLLETNQGILIITHSELLVEKLVYDNFVNIEGLSKEEWLSREIVATDFEALKIKADELCSALHKRLK